MECTKEDCITLRLLMFKLLLTDLTDAELDLIFRIQSAITEKLKEIGAYTDELILTGGVFRVTSPCLHKPQMSYYCKHINGLKIRG